MTPTPFDRGDGGRCGALSAARVVCAIVSRSPNPSTSITLFWPYRLHSLSSRHRRRSPPWTVDAHARGGWPYLTVRLRLGRTGRRNPRHRCPLRRRPSKTWYAAPFSVALPALSGPIPTAWTSFETTGDSGRPRKRLVVVDRAELAEAEVPPDCVVAVDPAEHRQAGGAGRRASGAPPQRHAFQTRVDELSRHVVGAGADRASPASSTSSGACSRVSANIWNPRRPRR